MIPYVCGKFKRFWTSVIPLLGFKCVLHMDMTLNLDLTPYDLAVDSLSTVKPLVRTKGVSLALRVIF